MGNKGKIRFSVLLSFAFLLFHHFNHQGLVQQQKWWPKTVSCLFFHLQIPPVPAITPTPQAKRKACSSPVPWMHHVDSYLMRLFSTLILIPPHPGRRGVSPSGCFFDNLLWAPLVSINIAVYICYHCIYILKIIIYLHVYSPLACILLMGRNHAFFISSFPLRVKLSMWFYKPLLNEGTRKWGNNL